MTNCSSISSIVWFQLPPRSKPYTNQHSTNPSICIESRFRKKNGAMVIFSETDLLFIFKKIRVFPLIWQMEISAKSNFAVSFVMIGCVCVCVVRTYIKVKILVKALQRTIRVTNINQENLKLFSPPKILLSQLISILLFLLLF